jgi:ribulose-5-phosphate 4-epimerase/fuculose-1-phosphate aldolase
MNNYQELKEQMVDVCRNAFNNKLFAGTSGNLSVYLRARKRECS